MPTIEDDVFAITKYGIREINPRVREFEERKMKTRDLIKCLGEKELYTFIRENISNFYYYPNTKNTPKWMLMSDEADFYSAYLLSHFRAKMRAWWNDIGRDKFKEWWRSKMVKFRRRIIHDDDDDEEADGNERRRILHDDNDTPPPPPPAAPAPEEAPLPPPVHANQIGDGGAPDIPAPPAPPRQEKKKKQKKPVPVYHYTLRRRN